VNTEGQRFGFGPSSSVGGIDSLAGLPRWYSARAGTDVVALRSDVENLLDVFEDHPDIGIEMLRVLARTLMTLQARVDRQTLSSQNEKAAQ
jgi:CRP-like cAMP-binding protein